MMINRIIQMSIPKLVISYIVALFIFIVVGYLAFFFPIGPLYSFLNLEFSNLGPIATCSWGVVFDLFVVTPLFIGLLIYKVVSKRNSKD